MGGLAEAGIGGVAWGWVLVGLLPWMGLGFFLALGVRLPRPLPAAPSRGGGEDDGAGGRPSVSVVVPARNEAANIQRCVASLAAQRYPDFEIVVVDDGSTDGTGDLARSVPPGHARALRVVPGRPLPAGWFGKPWACATGAEAARGELLLFTDADTTHGPELLARSVAAMQEDKADLLSLIGSQEMVTPAERLVQPQVFALIGMRFRSLHRVVEPERWRDAIANGQYMLLRRAIYDAMGGHAAVRGEVVEDLRMAQEVTRRGGRLTVRGAEGVFSTRMYTSLRELVNGWTKNVALGAKQASGGLARVALPGVVLFMLVAWVLPAAVLLGGAVALLVGGGGGLPQPEGGAVSTAVSWTASWTAWAALATGCTTAIWLAAYPRMGAPRGYGLLHPLGALVVVFILLRSWMRGSRRIEWKGRRYSGGAAEPR